MALMRMEIILIAPRPGVTAKEKVALPAAGTFSQILHILRSGDAEHATLDGIFNE